MKKLINEEVKKLQKIAGLLKEEDFKGEEPSADSPDSKVLSMQDIQAVKNFVMNSNEYNTAKRSPKFGEKVLGQPEKNESGQQINMYYRWDDPTDEYDPEDYETRQEWNDFRIMGIAFAKSLEDGKLGYWLFFGNGELDSQHGPNGYVPTSGDTPNLPMKGV